MGIAGGSHGGSAQGGSAQGGSAQGGRQVGTGGLLASGGSSGGTGGGTGGEVFEVPPLETFVGHYDLFVAPPDFDCEGLDGAVHLSLRLGDSGLEARVFQPFEWNGWPDSVEIDTTAGELVIRPGSGASLDGKITDDGIRFPYDADGSIWAGELVTGSTTVISECEGERVERAAYVDRIRDQSHPYIRERFTTRYNYYPFTWTLFRFSEPIGYTGDSFPWGSFTTTEAGDAMIELSNYADPMAPAPGSFQQWPWGPVAGLVIDEGTMRTGGSVWFDYVGMDNDAAGNALVSDLPFVSVVDLGPLAARHDFDVAPPLKGFWPASYEPPGGAGLCEGSNGCVILPQYPDSCQYPESLGGPHAFGFRVGGPDVEGGFTGGARVRYRVLSAGEFGAHHMFVETGTSEQQIALAPLEELPTDEGDFTHASPWSEFAVYDPLGPTDDWGLALSWECPAPGEPSDPGGPYRVLVIEWVEAISFGP